MSRALTIGRLFGIPFVVDASWLVFFAVLSWAVSTSSLLHEYGRSGSLFAAAAYSLLFFACIVIHELAHALVGRRFGVRTVSITLFMFGGVATIDADPPTPRAEILTAIAGPLASVILAGAAFGLSFVTGGIVRDLCILLALGNAVVATFNALPAFPMDGGRVLRAAVWALRHNRVDGTVFAAAVTATLAAGLAIGGLYLAFSTRQWLFAWYALVGAYVARAAWLGVREASLAGAGA